MFTILINHVFVGYSLPCSAGFICLTGSDVSNPTDGVKGYICPTGHYCSEGAVKELPCNPGTYAPSVQLGNMICLKEQFILIYIDIRFIH